MVSHRCDPYHCKISIPYSQTVLLNRICSNNVAFNQRSSKLEHLLHKREYNERVVRQEISKSLKLPINELLKKECNQPEKNKLTFNITYIPAFQNTKAILKKLQILLVPETKHNKVFPIDPAIDAVQTT